MKKIIVVTGGAGFIGSNLIKKLIKYEKYSIISLDNYSSGSKKNHIKNSRIKYLNGSTKDIKKKLNKYKKKIDAIFHFGEFSRIFQSFKHIDRCIDSNTIGTNAVIKFSLENKIRLIYSATSASLGNRGKDKNLSPYAFTKAKNLEYLENLKKWFNFKFEIIYFYNVYGPGHIRTGDMATVVGIFEYQFLKNLPLTVVKPGTQTRKFTHVNDTIDVCLVAWLKKRNLHYSVASKKQYSVLDVAKMFKKKIKFLPMRVGERYASALTKINFNNKINHYEGKINLKDYINDFLKQN